MDGPLSNLSNLKPLEEYLRDINSRNIQFAEVFPDLQHTIKNVASYDDLYKKLIDESYYICNELVKGKGDKTSTRTRNIQTEREREDLYNNINRALIFQSNENITHLNKEVDMMTPIMKTVDDNKSYFCSTNKFTNTEVKNLLNSKEKENMKNLEQTSTKNQNVVIQTNNNANNYPIEDLLFLINNAKEIEKNLEKEDPVQKIEIFENKITKNLRKLEELENTELKFVENKHEIESRENEINILLKQFDDKFGRLEEYLEIVKNIPTTHDMKFSKSKEWNESNNYNCTDEIDERTNDRSKYSTNHKNDRFMDIVHNISEENVDANTSNYNQISSYRNKNTPREFSQKINALLSNTQIREASELWKRFNYERLEGSSIERSYEMLNYIIRMKDRKSELISKRLEQLDDLCKDMKRKDAEIIELFAELETYKTKFRQMELQNKDMNKIENKFNILTRENTLLYKENLKLKTLLQQEKYLNTKNLDF